MSAQTNKAIARHYCEETWGRGNLAIVEELASSNLTVCYSIFPEVIRGSEGFKENQPTAPKGTTAALTRLKSSRQTMVGNTWRLQRDRCRHQKLHLLDCQYFNSLN